MNPFFDPTPLASEDLDQISWFITTDNLQAVDRVEAEIVAACRRLAKRPLMGTKRLDITFAAGAFLDRHQVSELSDSLSPKDLAATGHRDSSREAESARNP